MSDKIMYNTTGSALCGVELPMQTRTYKPISHAQLIDLTRESVDKSGFKLLKEEYTMARDGKQANGRYIIESGDTDMQIMVGWQNSYDKSLSLKFALGAQVFICSNGAVRGDMGNFKRKHQGDVQEFTPANIIEYIKGAGDTFQALVTDRANMKDRELTRRTQAELLGRMFIEDAVITATQLSIINKEIQHPTHDYNTPGSLWELYNYSTFALKEEHPANYIQSHINVHKFFTENIN